MSTIALDQLIRQASHVAGSPIRSCEGHDLLDELSRGCPKGWDDCRPPVLPCRTCGDYDYGTSGGPGRRLCHVQCSGPMAASDNPAPRSTAVPHGPEEEHSS